MDNIIFYGADWCSDCQRAKAYLNANNIEFEFVDVDVDTKTADLVEAINNGKRIIPTLIINGKSLTNPDNSVLASVLGLNKVGRVILYGADWCPDCRRAKSYLQNNDINYQFIDVDEHEWATDKVEKINKGKRIIPTILIDDKPYTNPDNSILKEVLKIGDSTSHEVYDTIIVGGGAAGLTASIYTQRDRFNTLILEKKNIGGNASLTEKIENYPGFTNISGPELMDKMAEQAKVYGAKIETGVEVKKIVKESTGFVIDTNMGNYFAKSIVLSVGSTYRRLNIPLEDELIGAGVHFCATCDGAFYRDKEILVIGGGNSALEEGIFLAGFCKKVTIINRKEAFSASETYLEKLKTIDNIEVHKNKQSVAFLKKDNNTFNGLQVKDNATGEISELYADGAFIFIGLIPNTTAFEGLIDLNEQGFIKTTGYGETNIPGIFAAGDVREGAIAQVAAATGEGVLASYGIRQYLK
jgi:thioredoxin reductase (NADPH)